jgi:hypothetical protein
MDGVSATVVPSGSDAVSVTIAAGSDESSTTGMLSDSDEVVPASSDVC